MNSSMLAGERRWASARRGGMTVLGKVTVPKPINLPSQRLENHGLDPNVEIIPKGTVGWGNRPSSSGSNPWNSSSPKADGGTVSPSHLSGRPSSGGSATRPSTSGSDRTHDPAPNAWASNSRPSSASGSLSSNQTSSTSLRPRSAENRPNSSQLSRFAEPVSKTSEAWGSSATAERLGMKSMMEDFSLSSGDFPTLGSEKDNPVKSNESEDCRPSSACGIVEAKEDNIPHADTKHGTVNTWRAESSPHAEDDIHLSMEKWQGDPHQYYNPNNAPHRFEGWRGPPMNGPAGGWYGGRPRGPSFGGHVPPGGFPIEPFPYYRPPPPRGPHPKNGDLYRPQMHEAYPRPSMPFRPNLYPGPPGPMPFEGYYGQNMGYCSSERDVPYNMGPPVYNGYPAPAPDASNSHGRGGVHGPNRKTLEQVEAGHSEDAYGPKRVALNSRKEYEQKEEAGNWEQNMPPNILQKTRFPASSSRRNEWGAEEDAEEAVSAKMISPRDNSSKIYGNRILSADTKKVKSFEGPCSGNRVDDNWTNNSEGLPSFSHVVPQLPVASEKDATKKSTLLYRIDGLNAKSRVSDGGSDSTGAHNRVEERSRSQILDRKVNNVAGSSQVILASRNHASNPDEATIPVGDNPVQSIAVVSRRSQHGGHPRVDSRGKGKFNADGWQRKPLTTDSSSAVIASKNESIPNIDSHGPNYVGGPSEDSIIDPAGKAGGDSVEACDSADIQAQRAKMREIAKQRALQLQKEEEERVREQKAKALAKLEELDRKKLAGEAANQKGERTLIIGDIPVEQQEPHTVIGTVVAELKTNESGFNLVLSPAFVKTDSSSIQQKGSLESNIAPLPRNEESGDGSAKAVLLADDGRISRHKRAGYNQKQGNTLQKNLTEKSVSSTTSAVQEDLTHAPSDSRLSGLNASNTLVEPPSAQQRKSVNRSNKPKPKPKPDETTPSAPTLPPLTSEISHGSESIDNGGSNKPVSNLGASVSTVSEPDLSTSSLPSEESQSKVLNQWKPQPTRRIPKNQQAHRFTDKHDTVVWAPKAKASDEVSQTSVQESAKGNNVVQSSLRGKRAEMERYVPKPQLAQQGNAPPSSSRSNEAAAGEQPATENVKSNKKENGTWRQRGPKDSSQVKGAYPEPSLVSEPTEEIEQSEEVVQFTNTTTAAVSKQPLAKDQGAAGRGKRHHQSKGSRSGGHNPDLENTSHGEVDGKSLPPDVNQMDKSVITKENRGFGDRGPTQWQRKSSPNSANNPQHDKETSSFTHRQMGQSVKAISNAANGSAAVRRHQDLEREKRAAPVGCGETNTDDQHKHNVRRTGRQNNRPVRAQDSRGEWSDNRPHMPARQRQNVQLEYQPVGPFKGEEQADSMDQRPQERGSSQPKREGNYYRR